MLGLLTFVIYLPATRYEFVDYDDGVYVYNNPEVLKGLSITGAGYSFQTADGGSWMPMTWFSHMLDTTLFGAGPAGRHFMGILLHAMVAGLLLIVLERMSGCLWLSTAAAAFFAIHPMRNESVAWIAERKDVLSGLFFMLGLLAYARHVERPAASRMGGVIICFLLGLMSKPMLVTFPFVLLLLDVWPLRRMGEDWSQLRSKLPSLLLEKWLLFLLAALASVMTYWSQKDTGAMSRWGHSWWGRAGDIIANYSFYLQKIFWPSALTVVYPEHKLSATLIAGFAAGLIGVTVFVLLRMFKQPWLTVGWFWFLGTLVPVIGIVPVGMSQVADRYSYLPSIGLCIAVVWLVAEILPNRLVLCRIVVVITVSLLAASAWATYADLARWKTSQQLFESALQVSPHKIAYDNLAYHHLKLREYDQTIELSTKAVELDPKFGASYSSLAMAYALKGDYSNAKTNYDRAIELGDRPIRATGEISPRSKNQRDPEADWQQFADSIGLQPKTADAIVMRAVNRSKMGHTEAAIADYTKALELLPENAQLYTSRGNSYALLSDWNNALADMTRAIELLPTNAPSYQNRAVIHFKMGEYEKAWADLNLQIRYGGRPHESFIQALTKISGGNLLKQ